MPLVAVQVRRAVGRRDDLLERCGHWIQQERPEEVNRLLADFLVGNV